MSSPLGPSPGSATGMLAVHLGSILIVFFADFFLSRGEVCTMAPLHMHEGMKDHPLYEQSFLALATLTKVFRLEINLLIIFTPYTR